MLEYKDLEPRWHEWGKATFLLRPVPLGLLFDLKQKVEAGEVTIEGALREIFNFSVVQWKGIQVSEECERHPQYRQASLDALWGDDGLRIWILDKLIEKLTFTTFALEESVKNFERFLFATGRLKS